MIRTSRNLFRFASSSAFGWALFVSRSVVAFAVRLTIVALAIALTVVTTSTTTLLVAVLAVRLFLSLFFIAIASSASIVVAPTTIAATAPTTMLCFSLRRTNSFGQFGTRYLNLQGALNVRERIKVLFANQRNGAALAASACGAANAVNIVFGIVRRIVVDHHRDVIDVNTASHNVGGHQEVNLVGTE